MGTLFINISADTLVKRQRSGRREAINSFATDHAFFHYKKNLHFPSTKDHAIIFHENKSFLPNLKWL
jgi:hypothetical protein